MSPRFPCYWLAACLTLSGCGEQRPAQAPPLQVVGVLPRSAQDQARQGTRAHPEPLWLNSRLAVHFSADVDPRTISADTVRVVKVTPSGPQRVPMDRRLVGRRVVELHPKWPITAALTDGSLVPGQLYRLEVVGFPRPQAVASHAGVPLGATFQRYFRTVDRDARDPGPLLPVGLPADAFELATRSLRMAADTRTVQLHFTLPVDPTSVSPRSFRFMQSEEIPIAAARVLTVRRPIYRASEAPGAAPTMTWSFPGSTVELRLAAGVALRPDSPFGVDLRPAGRSADWVRDYRGRPIQPDQAVVAGAVSRGSQVELIRIEGAQDIPFQAVAPELLSFESRSGRMQPLARREFGFGELGALRPDSDLTLDTRVHIRIDGELVLRTVHALGPAEFETAIADGYRRRVVERDFGCRLATAGNLVVNGAIRHALPDQTKGPPLVLLGRALFLYGPFPGGSILAQEPGRILQGTAQNGVQVAHASRPGLPAGRRASAAGWTPWYRLPKDFVRGRIAARALDARGDVEVLLQLAPPDPIAPGRPYQDPAGMMEPRRLPLVQPLEVTDQVFLRFQLRADVVGGEELPSVRGLVVVGG
jgi:hypothetical protein